METVVNAARELSELNLATRFHLNPPCEADEAWLSDDGLVAAANNLGDFSAVRDTTFRVWVLYSRSTLLDLSEESMLLVEEKGKRRWARQVNDNFNPEKILTTLHAHGIQFERDEISICGGVSLLMRVEAIEQLKELLTQSSQWRNAFDRIVIAEALV